MTFRVLSALFLTGCGGWGAGGSISLLDANNFAYTGDVTIPAYATIPSADVEVCWDAVSDDLQCDDLDPVADIDTVALTRFSHASQTEIEEKISTDDIRMADQSGYVEVQVEGRTCVQIDEMSFFGSEVDTDQQYNVSSTYLLTLATGEETGQGTRAMAFLTPTKGETNALVHLEPACGTLAVTSDLTSLIPVAVPTEGPWVVDWRYLTTNGVGAAISPSMVDGIMLGRYADTDLSILEDSLLDLDVLADEVWSATLGGTTGFELAELDGFTGFEGEGIWLMALTCSQCFNPAPLFLTVLQPVE